jgi:threonine dehydratase
MCSEPSGNYTSVTLVTLDDIRAAVPRIRPIIRRTPVLEVDHLYLKCENLQVTGAFKIRGAANMLALMPIADRAAGVITYSSGNHGQAMTCAAVYHRTRAVVVMPETAPAIKVEAVKRMGGEVIFAGTTSADRKARAEAEAAARGLTMIPPFDHPWIIAGAGTTGLEILEQCPQVTTVFVAMGGGGQISGVAAAIKQMRSGVRIEPDGAARMAASLAEGRPVALPRTASIADGLLTLRPGNLTFEHVQAYVDEVVTVTDEEIVTAVRWLFREAHLVAEPSGAATVAAALRARESGRGALAIVSGGNVDAVQYAGYLQQR